MRDTALIRGPAPPAATDRHVDEVMVRLGAFPAVLFGDPVMLQRVGMSRDRHRERSFFDQPVQPWRSFTSISGMCIIRTTS